jgi:hypothetical protein
MNFAGYLVMALGGVAAASLFWHVGGDLLSPEARNRRRRARNQGRVIHRSKRPSVQLSVNTNSAG